MEDVKSFWRILLVLASLIGFQLLDINDYSLVQFAALAPDKRMYAVFIQTFNYLVIVVAVPLYQFVARPYFFRCIPKMLTKIGIGL